MKNSRLDKADQEIIDQIQEVRARNNKLWMDLLRLAMKHAPKEAKKIFNDIKINDQEVTKLSEELANGKE